MGTLSSLSSLASLGNSVFSFLRTNNFDYDEMAAQTEAANAKTQTAKQRLYSATSAIFLPRRERTESSRSNSLILSPINQGSSEETSDADSLGSSLISTPSSIASSLGSGASTALSVSAKTALASSARILFKNSVGSQGGIPLAAFGALLYLSKRESLLRNIIISITADKKPKTYTFALGDRDHTVKIAFQVKSGEPIRLGTDPNKNPSNFKEIGDYGSADKKTIMNFIVNDPSPYASTKKIFQEVASSLSIQLLNIKSSFKDQILNKAKGARHANVDHTQVITINADKLDYEGKGNTKIKRISLPVFGNHKDWALTISVQG